jgi:uncharacterized protein YggE
MKYIWLLVLSVFSVSTFASSIPDFPFVTVTGESVRKVEPDNAKLSFYIITFDKEAVNAKLTLDKTSKEVVKLLKANDVQEKDIISSELNKRVKRARDKSYNELGILGYDFIQRFEVTLHNLKRYSELTNALLATNNVENIASQFDFSKRDLVEVELIKEAAAKAKQKAKHMASGLGVRLGSVFAFNDSGSYASFFAKFGLSTDRSGYLAKAMRSEAENSNAFIPQYIEVSKSINVVYKIQN